MKVYCLRSSSGILFLLLWILSTLPVRAEEGMWTFDNPPAKQLKEKYGFAITQQWLDHVRLSSVRFNDGGSGSFISPRGLILTNHHVALGQLQKVSSEVKDYVNNGFYAASSAEEIKCPDLELNVLISMENVTPRVQGAVRKGMSDREGLQARKAEIAKIEKESLDATGFRSDVVSMYAGGEYWLYRYKKYTDVRLVFAPEQQAAFFGGDPDNFTYPRHDLDIALFRAYENGKPVESKNFLKWNSRGAEDNELVFVSGNPGTTNRLSTVRQIEGQRDVVIPETLKLLRRRLDVLRRYAAAGQEQERQATSQMRSLENSLKVYEGEYKGLLGTALTAKKEEAESAFRARIASNPDWTGKYVKAWDEIAAAEEKRLSRYKELRYRSLRASRIGTLALNIVQYVAEVQKPDGQRIDGFHDSQVDSFRLGLFSPAPIYPQMEIALLMSSLQESKDELGGEDPFVKAALGESSPAEIARQVIEGSRLSNPSFRKELVEGGPAAVAASADPAIVLARKIDPIIREVRKWMEDNVESVLLPAGEKIGQARFAVYGKSVYPDATFTLRLSYGTVKGYPMNGTRAQTKTTFYGLYDRSIGFDNRPPYNLPARFIEGRSKLNLATPLNFICTCDTIGGNSGSPVINGKGEIVGLIFDGNIESLVGDYVYNDEDNRSVAVHTGAIIEALKNLYGAPDLVKEITNWE
jgi:hypothetical protein